MGERKHKTDSAEKKEKDSKGIKTRHQITHPILQLQRLLGNKTVTKMIQRHPGDVMSRYAFKAKDVDTGRELWHRGEGDLSITLGEGIPISPEEVGETERGERE